MRIKRLSKSIAALMTAVMLVGAVPTTALTALAADGDAGDMVVEDATDEIVEESVIEDITENIEEDPTENIEENPTETFVEEAMEDGIEGLVEDPIEVFDEELEENRIEAVEPTPYHTQGYGCTHRQYIKYQKHKVYDNGGASSLYDSEMYQVLFGGMSEDNHPSATRGLPSDYWGLGYFLETYYNIDKYYVNHDSKMAVAVTDANIYTKEGRHYLHLEGKYEISVFDVWAESVWKIKDPTKTSDPQKYVPDGPKKEDPTPTSNDYLTKNSGLQYHVDGTYSVGNKSTDWGSHGRSYSYVGPNGKIPIKWTINDQADVDYRIKSDGKSYVHDELKVKIPTVSYANSESYYGEFSYEFLLGHVASGTWVNGDKTYEKDQIPEYDTIKQVVITEILGVPVRMYVTQNAFYPDLVEDVAIVDRQFSGGKTTYTIKLDTNAAISGKYYFTFEQGNNVVKKEVWPGKGKNSQEITVTMPSSSEPMHITSIISDGYGVRYDDTNIKRAGGYKYDSKICVEDRSFSVEVRTRSDYVLGQKNMKLRYDIDYKVSTPGQYKFVYTYYVDGREKTFKSNVEFDGLEKENLTISHSFPVNSSEIWLSNIESPDGVIEYKKQMLYRNADIIPELPTEFEATIDVLKERQYSFSSGYNGLRAFSLLVEYASPNDESRTIHIEYKDNGEVKEKEVGFKPNVGYGMIAYSIAEDTLPEDYKSPNGESYNQIEIYYYDLDYIKITSIDTADGDSYECEKYLYCQHEYYDCDAECHRCHLVREVTHDFSEDCTTCKICKMVTDNKHQYNPDNPDCDPDCDVCGAIRDDSELVHEYDGPCDSECNNCHKIRDNIHSFYPEDDLVCDYCKYSKQLGWVKENGKWYYYHDHDKMAKNEWQLDGKQWYYLGVKGAMVTNHWVRDGEKWYYVDANGKYLKNKWKTINGDEYYFGENGVMYANRWKEYKGKYYYLGANGRIVTEQWISYGKAWYYVGKTGVMETNKWIDYKGKTYYVDEDGIMAIGIKTINGKKYKFDSNGALIK